MLATNRQFSAPRFITRGMSRMASSLQRRIPASRTSGGGAA
jgi:lipopolysaccharide export system permease protein